MRGTAESESSPIVETVVREEIQRSLERIGNYTPAMVIIGNERYELLRNALPGLNYRSLEDHDCFSGNHDSEQGEVSLGVIHDRYCTKFTLGASRGNNRVKTDISIVLKNEAGEGQHVKYEIQYESGSYFIGRGQSGKEIVGRTWDYEEVPQAIEEERLRRAKTLLETWTLMADPEQYDGNLKESLERFKDEWGEENYQKVQCMLEEISAGELGPCKRPYNFREEEIIDSTYEYLDNEKKDRLILQNFINEPTDYRVITFESGNNPKYQKQSVWVYRFESCYSVSCHFTFEERDSVGRLVKKDKQLIFSIPREQEQKA